MKSQFLTVSEIAEFFKFSKSSAYRLIGSNAFPYIRLGQRFLIWSEDLEEWIRNKQRNECLMPCIHENFGINNERWL
jgi:excisionase family DNA binding protein